MGLLSIGALKVLPYWDTGQATYQDQLNGILPEEEERCLCNADLLVWFGGSASPIRSGLSDDLGLFDALLPLPNPPGGGRGAARFLLALGGVEARGLVERELTSWT